MAQIKAYVFDAYGTLFDVHSLLNHCKEMFPGYGAQLTTQWRTKQLQYTWLRSLMGRYEDFWKITGDALENTCQTLGLHYTPDQIDVLMKAYLKLSPFSDWAEVLDALAGTPCAILSNGTSAMLSSLVKHAGWEGKFQHILTVDTVKVYKPHPSVYQLVVSELKVKAQEIMFVSSNGWDAAGAKTFGFQVCWLNRTTAPIEILGAEPDRMIKTALQLKEV